MKKTEKQSKQKPNKKRRTYRNRVIMIVSLILAVAVTVAFLQEFILCNPNHNNERVRGFYLEDEHSLDVVVIGSSEVYCAFAPGLCYKECGFTSYPLATEGNTCRNFKALFNETIRTQDPKLIIIEINGALYNDANLDRDANLRRVTDNIPLNENKVELVEERVTSDQIEYYAPFIKYHGSWDNLSNTFGWSISLMQDQLRGYTLLKGVKTFNQIYQTTGTVFKKDDAVMKRKRALFNESSAQLKEFLQYLKDEGVSSDKVLFVRFPHVTTPTNITRYQRGNTIGQIVRNYGYKFVSFEQDDPEINLDPYNDFYNIEHMNIYGQQKFSKYFAHYLQDNYNITPTELTSSQKEKWDKTIPYYDAYVKYNIAMIESGAERTEIGESYFVMREIKKYLEE